MFRKYDAVQCQNIEKFEKDKHYKFHMSKVYRSKCCVDTTQPELSPRHRMIAQKAEARRKDYMKKSRANISPKFNVKGFPYTSRSSQMGGPPTSIMSQKIRPSPLTTQGFSTSTNNINTTQSSFNSSGLPKSPRSQTSIRYQHGNQTKLFQTGITNTQLFRSPAQYAEPGELDFLGNFVPFKPTQTRHEIAMMSARAAKMREWERSGGLDEEESESEDLEDDLSSVSSDSLRFLDE
ncbi:hypothetical protein TRFO_08646 [Tritrichomonas foetus]|uniref:Uncharacterized protein n=1 Tax=Tritrichomonas foetus TaxID=1144522 RepID=A0A1J4JIR9_9EUKA|nr:hypothetical protein TRFO_08646 [Tritrichomonas foetus]|eukprot:OHS99072.1 hypothetical protein TRFO_08646 [Tritrichomonas foetus]